MKLNYFTDTKHTQDSTGMKNKGFSEGDGVFALGFPVSLIGDKSNSVGTRLGE